MRDVEDSYDGGCGCDPAWHRIVEVPQSSASTSVSASASARPPSASASAGHSSEVPAPSPSRRHFLRTATFAALGGPALFAAACSSAAKTPVSRHVDAPPSPKPPASRPLGGAPFPAGTATATATGPESADAALLSSKYSGLKPFANAPAPPAQKPVVTEGVMPPVVDHIPGLPDDHKIVFLTIDDGAEKDPAFLDMVKDFKVPITLFLCDEMIKDDYSYFTKLLDTGYVTIQNHTLTHPNLQTVSAERQAAEISGQQAKLKTEYGVTPYLFRAPFGNSNATTQQVCKDNGLKAIMYWRATFQKQGFQWQDPHKQLHPGDILLSHFRGPVKMGAGWPEMHQLMINLFRIVQDQGFTFARLEDYV